jgi:hypothetical protein
VSNPARLRSDDRRSAPTAEGGGQKALTNDRLKLLKKFYRVSRWEELAAKLALDHVPGFQFIDPGGRSGKWSVPKMSQLISTVDQVKKQQELRHDNAACDFIAKRERDESKFGAPSNYRHNRTLWSKNLQARLSEARKKLRSDPSFRRIHKLLQTPLESLAKPSTYGN